MKEIKMIKVKFLKPAYPYRIWDEWTIMENIVEQFLRKGIVEVIKEETKKNKKEIKNEKNKSITKNKKKTK